MPMNGVPQFQNTMGEVEASPTENTLLERSKVIETALDSMTSLSTDVKKLTEEVIGLLEAITLTMELVNKKITESVEE